MNKKHLPRYTLFLATLFFALPLVSRGEEGGSSPILINPGSIHEGKYMMGWRHSFLMRHIREWGRTRGLDVVDDGEPVVDGTAAFVGPAGSSIKVSGLSRWKRYRIWIDFVRFRDARSCPPAILRITAAAPGGGTIMLRDLHQWDLGESYFCLELPPEATVGGNVEIRFTEFSQRSGLWGVWDIIIAEGDSMPLRGEIRDDQIIDLEIKDKILE